ncbi:MAG: hypothetical protein LBE57_04920 [Methanosarcinales archaeon]|jgi:CHASE2 domain-containing sensor protein|nr:hypothetical protein [Methanosarcinales archaeon]
MKKNVYLGLWICFGIATLILAGYGIFVNGGIDPMWGIFTLISAVFSVMFNQMWRKEKKNEG